MSTSVVHDRERSMISSAAHDAVHNGLPDRICFGMDAGRTRLPAELRHVNAERVLILCSDRHVSTVRQISRPTRADHDVEVMVLGRSDSSFADVPIPRPHQFDAVVAVGGGTLIGWAKRVCAVLDLPLIALPTTYSAAELDHRVQRMSVTGPVLDTVVAPTAVIYDPCVTLTLSPRQTALSLLGVIGAGIEVLRHVATESLPWALAHHGLREIGRAALDTVYCPSSLAARSVVQFGAYLVGAAVATAQTCGLASACRELVAVTGIRYPEARAMATLWLADTAGSARPDVHEALLAAWPLAHPSRFVRDLAAGPGAALEFPEPAARHVADLVHKYEI